MNRLLDYGTLVASAFLIAVLCIVNMTNTLSAACPDEAPDPESYCQSTEDNCSVVTIPAGGSCTNTDKIITGCGQSKDTRTQGPFKTKYAAGQQTKTGPKQLCNEHCACVLGTEPDPCNRSCGPSTDPLQCQSTDGDTILADVACQGGG